MARVFKPQVSGFPPPRMPCKVVQLYLGENKAPCLAVGRTETQSHGEILAEFLRENRIEYDTTISLRSERNVPCHVGSCYRTIGMGSVASIEQGSLMFYGFSMDYSLEINGEHLNRIVGAGLIPENLELLCS